MAGLTDVFNRLSLSLALWNGVDPIIKERMFGLSGPEGNHGEDVKDYWWYLDALPSSAWLTLALSLSAGRVPVRRPRPDQRRALQARARIRAHRHRRVRRRPLLDRRGPLREGITDRRADADHGPQPRPGNGDAPCAADPVVPQRMELESGGRQARAHHHRWWDADRGQPCRSWAVRPRRRAEPRRLAARAAVLRERDQSRADRRQPEHDALSEGRHQRPRGRGRRHGQPGGHRHEGRGLVPADRAGRRDRRDPPAAPSTGRGGARRQRGDSAGPARSRIRDDDAPAARPRRTSSTRSCVARTRPTTRP